MMPLIVKDFTWHQTPTAISLVVPMRGLNAKKTDVLTSSNYLRIHCHPYIFEAFLYSQVDDEKGNCTIDQEKGIVFLNFPKIGQTEQQEEEDWPSLEAQGLDRGQKKVLRDNAVKTAHERHRKSAEDSAVCKDEKRKMSVREQMRMDQELREKVAVAKNHEAQLALSDVQKWTEQGEMLSGETMSHVGSPAEDPRYKKKIENVSNRPGGLAVAQRLTKKGVGVGGSLRQKFKPTEESLEELVARGPATVSILSSDEECDDYNLHAANLKKKVRPLPSEARRYLEKISSKSSASIWPEVSKAGGGDGALGIRQPQKITVQFTPRDFLTPARESSAHLEEEWLKKQAEARRLSGFNEPDLSPEERDPDWLLEKGKSLMRTDCHLGAISAFCLALKLAPKMPELYAERATAHLHIRNFVKVVDDSSLALELLTPKVTANAAYRLKCHVTRAEGYQALKLYSEAFLDLQEAVRISPQDEKLKQRLVEAQELVNTAVSDSDCD